MAISELKIYSIGTAAENKKLGLRVLEVTPIEDSPMLDGEINSDKVSDTVQSEDAKGGKYNVKTTTANSIPATWLPIGSGNRHTAPDVRRGEMVVLYRYSDEDKFFWTTLHDDLALRKLETVVYAWSGTKDEDVTEVTAASHYFMEVSTHKGQINLQTSKANGEFCAWNIQLNTKEGFFQIKDDVGNVFHFDAQEKQLSMLNADGTYLEINKQNMTLNVPETLTVIAKNLIQQIGEDLNTTVGKGITEKSATFDLKTDRTVNVNAGSTGTYKSSGPTLIDGKGVVIKTKVQLL